MNVRLQNISFVVISHNEEKNIRDCMNSLIELDYPKDLYEIIVIDSSTDRTKEIVREYRTVKLINSDIKFFPVVRNIGLKTANYDLIAFIDADCVVPPDWIQKILPNFKDNKIAGVGGNAYPPLNSKFLGKCIAAIGKPAGGAIGFDSELGDCGNEAHFLGTGHSMFRKNILVEVGGFDEKLKHGDEDNELCERILDAGYILKYEPSSFLYHKPRETLKEFIKWSFKRGRGSYLANRVPLWKLVLNPFSILWIALFLLFSGYIIFNFRITEVLLTILSIIFSGLIFVKLLSYRGIFPTGREKIKLLIQRRKRIGVTLIHISFIILPLFFIDRLIMNLGGIYQFLDDYNRSLK